MTETKFILTRSARADLKKIGQYTAKQWGVEQEKRYLIQIFERFSDLAENPHIGRERPDIKSGYRSIVEDRHVIFYRIKDSRVEILGVIHGQRDLKRAMETPANSRRVDRS